jgi:polyadenylate-binding protein 2
VSVIVCSNSRNISHFNLIYWGVFFPEEASPGAEADKLEVDARSVYVGQVEYSCTIEELDAHFRGCGTINRITIMCDRFSGHPKG